MVGIANSYARPVWVVFTHRGKVPRLWHLFTTKDFGHCYVLIETIAGVMRLDQSLAGITMYEIPCTIDEYLQANEHTACVRFNVVGNVSQLHLRGFLNCVTFVKAILIKCPWWVFSPKQLYDWMVNNGKHFKQA